MIITIKQYYTIQELQKKYKDDVDTLGMEIIKVFKGEDLSKISLEESEVLLNDITAQLTNVKELPLVHRFKQDGVSFGFIPNLEDISVGEFIDLDSLMKQDPLQLEQIMSVLYRPVKKSWFSKYSIEDYTGTDKYNKIFLNTDFRIILGAIFFFAILKESLLNHLDTYTPQMNTLKKKMV